MNQTKLVLLTVWVLKLTASCVATVWGWCRVREFAEWFPVRQFHGLRGSVA